MTEIYRDFYGCFATLKAHNNGKITLTVRTAAGTLVHSKAYSSKRGAKIAMGRLSDGWNLVRSS